MEILLEVRGNVLSVACEELLVVRAFCFDIVQTLHQPVDANSLFVE